MTNNKQKSPLTVSPPYRRELTCNSELVSYASGCLATSGAMHAELVLSEVLDKEGNPSTSTLGVGRGADILTM
jgi:hypothetical protein